MDILASLDPEQKKAVLAEPKPLMVMAGAGSGKTRVLTTRVAHQILDGTTTPKQMFVSAFTKAAADEMYERVSLMVDDHDDLSIGTFHSLMYRFMNDWRTSRNLPRLDVCKESEKKQILQGLLGKPSKDYPQGLNVDCDLGNVMAYIGGWKNNLIFPSDPVITETINEAPNGSDLWAAATIYASYQKELEGRNKVDFDDMLMKSYWLLAHEKAARARAQGMWNAFFVDEAQDTNHAQWEILKLIAPPDASPNVTIVGDTRQALYRFRGAIPELMEGFLQTYQGAKRIDLVRNYRSSSDIVGPSNRMIKGLRLPDQVAHRKKSREPFAVVFNDVHDQAIELADMITELRDEGVSGGDIAVLIRTNAQSAEIESAFVSKKIPYWCKTGGFFDRMEIGDVMAYLRLSQDRNNEFYLGKIINRPTRYLGRVFVEAVQKNAADNGTDLVDALRTTTKYAGRNLWAKQLAAASDLADLLDSLGEANGQMFPTKAIDQVLQWTDYMDWLKKTSGTTNSADDSRKENIEALKEIASRFTTIQQLIDFADESTNLQRESNDSTEICTVHRSKGREWPIVVCTNFYEGSIPHKSAMREGTQAIEDERRIAYVAFTRAKDLLVVASTRHNDKSEPVQTSRFVYDADIPALNAFPEWYNDIISHARDAVVVSVPQ